MSAGEAAGGSRAAQDSARAARDDIYRVVSLLWQLERFFDPSRHASPHDYRVEADLPPRLPPTGVRAGERPDGAGAPAWMEAPPRRIERGGQSPVTIAWVEPAEPGVPESLPRREVPPGLAPSIVVPVAASGPGETAAATGWMPPPVAAAVQATGAPPAPVTAAPRQPPRPPGASGPPPGSPPVPPGGGATRRDARGVVPLEEAPPAPAGTPGPGPAGSRPPSRSDAGSEDGAPPPAVSSGAPSEAGRRPPPGARAPVPGVPDQGEAAPSPAGREGSGVVGRAPAPVRVEAAPKPVAAGEPPPAERVGERTPSEPFDARRGEPRAAGAPGAAAPARRPVGDGPAPPRAVLIEAGGVVPSQSDLARPTAPDATGDVGWAGDAAHDQADLADHWADDRADDWADHWADDRDDPGGPASGGPVEVTLRRRGSSVGALGRTEARRLEEELRRRFLDRPGRTT